MIRGLFFPSSRHMLSLLALGLIAGLVTPAAAAQSAPFSPEESFDSSVPLDDGELAVLRGGFIDVSGVKLDFELVNRTIIDGIPQSEFSISTESIGQLTELSQTIIQVGESNEFADLTGLVDIPNLLTIVQNSQDNTLIQNLNELDLTIQNFSELRSNAALSNAIGLMPPDGLR